MKPEHMARREDRWNAGYRDARDGLPPQSKADGYMPGYDAGWIAATTKNQEQSVADIAL